MSNLKKFLSKENKQTENFEQKTIPTDKISDKQEIIFIKKIERYLPLILIILTFVIFIKSLNCDFLNWDDDRYVTGNPHLQLTFENIKYFFTHYYFVMYIPLTMFSYMIDYAISGLQSPWLFHLHNLILHLANTLLVFYVVKKIFSKYENSTLLAFFTALLFAIHPMHVESVVWIAERKDVLYAFYFFLALIFYLKFIENRKKTFLIFSFISYIFSLLAKTQAVVLPLIMMLIDYLNRDFLTDKEKLKSFLKFDKKQWKIFAEKIPFLLLSVIFAVVAIKAYASGTNVDTKFGQHRIALQTGYNFIETIVLVSYSLLMYVVKLIIPFKQAGIHPYPFEHGQMPTLYFTYTLFSILYFATLIWAWLKKRKILFFSLGFFIASIFIVLKIKNFIISEHYEYIPATGIFIGISFFVLDKILNNKRLKPIILTISLIWLIFISITTIRRISVYENSLTFWQDIKKKYPKVIVAYYNNANYLQALGDKSETHTAQNFYKQAIEDYLKTLELDSTYVGAYTNAGITYAKLGKYNDAVKMFNKAIKLDTTQAMIYSNRGNVLALLGKWQQAISDYNKAINLKPDYVDALYNRGIAYLNTGKYDESIKDFTKTIELNSQKIEAYKQRGLAYYYNNMQQQSIDDLKKYLNYQTDDEAKYYLALAYEKNGQNKEAKKLFKTLNNKDFIEQLFQKISYLETLGDRSQKNYYYELAKEELQNILKINKSNSQAYMRLAVIEAKENNISKAFDLFNKAITLDSNNQEAYANRGYAYLLTKQYSKAMRDFNKALELNPNDATTYFNMAVLYEQTNNLSKAINYYTKVTELEKNNYLGYFRRALLYLKQNKSDEACNDFNTAYKLGYTEAKNYIDRYCKNGE